MAEVFRDHFRIARVDQDGKRFDRVSRVEAKSETYDCEMTLDINSEVYPLITGDRILLSLATSLTMDVNGRNDQASQDYWRQQATDVAKAKRGGLAGAPASLADAYEYVMYGKTFKVDDTAGSQKTCRVIISFGGLLLQLEGSYSHLSYITKGSNIYLLVRKEAQ